MIMFMVIMTCSNIHIYFYFYYTYIIECYAIILFFYNTEGTLTSLANEQSYQWDAEIKNHG